MTKVVKALKNIIQHKRSGKLIIKDALDSSIIWEAYFGNGNLHFATSVQGQRERLIYLIGRDRLDLDPSEFMVDRSDYQFICDRWQSGELSLQQTRQIALAITQEAFVQIMAIENADIEFIANARLEILILSTSVREIIISIEKQILQWQKIRSYISSPLARAYLTNVDSLYQLLWPQLRSNEKLEVYRVALTQNFCLYSIANQLNIDVRELCLLLLPPICNRSIQVSGYGKQQTEERPLIVWIDNDRTEQNSVKSRLESQGYEVIRLTKSDRSVTNIIHSRPLLILVDLSMPDLNGYELCQLIRKSPSLKHVPTIAICSHDRLFDRFKAKMFGANDCISKPSISTELVALVNNHISQLVVNTSQINHKNRGNDREISTRIS